LSAQKVLDSWALLCYLEQEPGHEAVIDLLEKASALSKPLLMSVVNWGEVVYRVIQCHGDEKAAEVERIIRTFPITIIDADQDLTREAARLKATKKMSYADCFAAALAKVNKAELVTGDKEFKQIASEIRVKWL
jgi:uncharacterized protein